MNHSRDSMAYAFGPLLGEWAEQHQHILVKDPERLGWKCEVEGCGFFKPAEEFDGIAVLSQLTRPDEAMVGGGS